MSWEPIFHVIILKQKVLRAGLNILKTQIIVGGNVVSPPPPPIDSVEGCFSKKSFSWGTNIFVQISREFVLHLETNDQIMSRGKEKVFHFPVI